MVRVAPFFDSRCSFSCVGLSLTMVWWREPRHRGD